MHKGIPKDEKDEIIFGDLFSSFCIICCQIDSLYIRKILLEYTKQFCIIGNFNN